MCKKDEPKINLSLKFGKIHWIIENRKTLDKVFRTFFDPPSIVLPCASLVLTLSYSVTKIIITNSTILIFLNLLVQIEIIINIIGVYATGHFFTFEMYNFLCPVYELNYLTVTINSEKLFIH